ncbi:MAG TPA: hypothetical protein VFE25_14650 [Opitutaceae bacterium]|nr:hypothetical protein [Opitutaceae bacterium]
MIRTVTSFEALVGTPFADGVNALCWQRSLPWDFTEVLAHLGPGEGIVPLDEERLQSLSVGNGGRAAIDGMLADLRALRERGLAPELNCIHGYPRDDKSDSLPTDVYSFHADSAPVEADTWLCTYHGAPSEGLLNAEARRRTEVPSVRAELLHRFGGADGEAFADHLQEACHDLHYLPLPDARPYSFGVGHLWRIAIDYPGSPVPPCIHRAPITLPGDPPRLLLIS